MATHHEIVGEEWQSRASELAEWAMEKLVNRKDVWGQYSVLSPSEQRTAGRSYKAMTLPRKDMRGADMVTIDKLTRHFSSRHHRKPQIIGLHAKSKETTSRWFGIDIDCHDTNSTAAEDHGRRNLVAAIKWWKELQDRGYDPLLFDSSGAGGYHLWVLFEKPAPTEDIFAMAKAIAMTWENNNLDEEPETFPKRPRDGSLGSWFRLPGLHHTLEHYSTVYSGDEWLSDPWLSGHAAIDVMLEAIPGPPPPASEADRSTHVKETLNSPRATRTAIARKQNFERTGRATVCIDLDGVLLSREYNEPLDVLGEPIDGAIEFTREIAEVADIIIFTARFSAAGDTRQASSRKLETRIRDWLDEHGFSYHDICTDVAKPVAHAYIDDRAVPCRPLDDGLVAFSKAKLALESLL